jgi:pimeloyl-ACP methyl ester carboxylesterase
METVITKQTVYDPTPLELGGRWGSRYWVDDPFPFTGNDEVNERLSGYPVAIFQPERAGAETPLVVGLQGMAAPYQWNAFMVPILLDMGIACILFDTPLAGERSLARTCSGEVVNEVIPLIERRVAVGPDFLSRVMEAVTRDFRTVLGLADERHGLGSERLALFGVSLGALLSSYAFLKEGIGSRLLCAIGHSDLCLFARSYSPRLLPLLTCTPVRLLGRLAAWCGARTFPAALEFLSILGGLCAGTTCPAEANPMTYADRAGPDRRVRFLVGGDDPLVRPEDAHRVARQFPDGECYVVPGLGHGGDNFADHARTYLGTQLGDWQAW